MQKMCPPDEVGGPQCNKEVLERLSTIEIKKDEANPLWKGLEKFKNLK